MHIFLAAGVCNTGGSGGLITSSSLPHTCADSGNISTILITLFTIVGALAFLFMVIAGVKYALSKGEPDNVAKAKNEIKYSLYGLIISASAAAIVNFVLGKL